MPNRTPKSNRPPTQADVARHAGVSQAVVSYVLNDSPVDLPEETRERIRSAIAEIGYVPNGSARSLRTRKTMTIACIIPDITNPFYPEFVHAVQRVAEAHQYDLIVSNTDGELCKEARSIRGLYGGRVDGAVMVPFHVRDELLLPLIDQGCALTLLHQRSEALANAGVDFLNTDLDLGLRLAVERLVSRGRVRIGMISGAAVAQESDRRVGAYLHALVHHQIPVQERWLIASDYTEIGGYAAMNQLLDQSDRPDALFGGNDLMALGAMRAAFERGVSIPHDIALIGMDDIPAAALVRPALTTVTQFTGELGTSAADLLMSRLEGRSDSIGRVQLNPCGLIVRESA